MKTVDLTIRDVVRICDKYAARCTECPLFTSIIDCFKVHRSYINPSSYDRDKLFDEDVNVEEDLKDVQSSV